MDFAVWVPHADRMKNMRAMEGQKIDASGKIVPLIMYGPPNAHEWEKCYRVWRTMAVSNDDVGLEITDRYCDRVMKLDREYPGCWPLLYQTDVRTRTEQALRVKRRLKEAHDAAVARGRPQDSTYNVDKPWASVYRELALGEDKWWEKEFEKVAYKIGLKAAAVNTGVDNDAPAKGWSGGLIGNARGTASTYHNAKSGPTCSSSCAVGS